jgi:hypothetical protein
MLAPSLARETSPTSLLLSFEKMALRDAVIPAGRGRPGAFLDW